MGLVQTSVLFSEMTYAEGDILLKAELSPAAAGQPMMLRIFKDGDWTNLFLGVTDNNGIFMMPFYVDKHLIGPFLNGSLSFPLSIQAFHIAAPDIIDPTIIYMASVSNTLTLIDPRGGGGGIPWLWIAVGLGAVALVGGIIWYSRRRKPSAPMTF